MFPLCILLLVLLISYLEFIYQLGQANIESMQALFQYILNIEDNVTDIIIRIPEKTIPDVADLDCSLSSQHDPLAVQLA